MPSLEQIYDQHHAFVWRVVRRLGVPDAGVDDAVQEVFVVMHRRREELRVEGSVRALLYGITRKIAKRHRDRAGRRAARLQLVPEPHAEAPDDPETQMQLRQRAEIVRNALDAMDEDKRMMFLLADIEGLSVPEAAACVGVNVNTAYARLRAARQLMHKAIARHRARQQRVRAPASR
jgi:RNA polymerase sigma-70 factor (ECF subfamily)